MNTFFNAWQAARLGELDNQQMALRGGELARTPAEIFVAGYQAAIRETFPTVQTSHWLSFAVTENRDAGQPVTEQDGCLYGTKTWIAAADLVQQLVVKVGSGGTARFVLVDCDDTVNIQTRPAKFLEDMAQGSAVFNGSAFKAITDVSRAREFRNNEPRFIYLAFIGYCRHTLSMSEAQTAEREDLESQVAELLDQMDKQDIAIGNNWQTDRRLFTMYRRPQ